VMTSWPRPNLWGAMSDKSSWSCGDMCWWHQLMIRGDPWVFSHEHCSVRVAKLYSGWGKVSIWLDHNIDNWQRWAAAWSKAGWGGSRTSGDICGTTLLTNHTAVWWPYMAVSLRSDTGGSQPINHTINCCFKSQYGTGPVPYYGSL